MEKNPFKLHRHDLTYYFDELYDICHGGKEEVFDQEKYDEMMVYRQKRDNDIKCVMNCAKMILTDSEYLCFYLFYIKCVQQEEIADMLDISQPAVNKFIRKSIDKVRRNVCTNSSQIYIEFDLNLNGNSSMSRAIVKTKKMCSHAINKTMAVGKQILFDLGF